MQKMEPQNPPSKIARLTDSGFGLTSRDGNWRMKKITNGSNIGGEEGSAQIGVSLELGCGSSHGYRHTCPKLLSGFTFLQLQELEHQALIYKHMEAGLSVPYHLLLPIWKSVANSLDSSSYPHYPGFCSPLYLDLKRNMDPEPGRCRRTDGKKWRCSKDAVEDHKYCERHINRGRLRSRKHVEPSQLSTSTCTTTVNDTSSNLSISFPICKQL